MYQPRYPALVKDRVRWVGDYVAFVVAETMHQAMDAAELIEVDYEPLPAVVATADATAAGAPLVFDDCPNNICFVQLFGDKAATDAAFAQAAHVVKHRLVINRRYCGEHGAARQRWRLPCGRPALTVYSTLQRTFPFREDLAKTVLKVPENRVCA